MRGEQCCAWLKTCAGDSTFTNASAATSSVSLRNMEISFIMGL